MISIGQLGDELKRGRRGWHLIGGRILEAVPRGAVTLPAELGPDAVLGRIDVEEHSPYSRPLLQRSDLGRDFWLGDESGRALVRVGLGGHVHPDVELHLDMPFVERAVPSDDDDDVTRAAYVRVLRTGDPVYVWGRATLSADQGDEHAGYRDMPFTVELSPLSEIHIYDEAAFRQWSAWRLLPWYRKLSVLVRNR